MKSKLRKTLSILLALYLVTAFIPATTREEGEKCKIGGMTYATLDAALEAASETEQTAATLLEFS